MKTNLSVGVVVVTYNGEQHLPKCLPYLINSPLGPRVLIVDSSSCDGTVEEAKRLGAETMVIRKELFNHGATREMARKVVKSDIVVMMTQDACPDSYDMLEKLIAPILESKASFSYARQLPRKDADIFEAFPRLFNYPAESHIRSIDDVDKYGVLTFFCSNSCAAYLNSALEEIGGFKATLTNEDYLASAMLLLKGHKVAYVADAEVTHSHRLTLWQEFNRYFDTGYVRAENAWMTNIVGPSEKRGKEFLFTLLREVATSKPTLLPYAVIHTAVKWIGYRMGYMSLRSPVWWKRLLSGQREYWDYAHHVSNQHIVQH